MEEHEASAFKINIAHADKEPNWRWRGRCSCGDYVTHMHFSRDISARIAVKQVHIEPIQQSERTTHECSSSAQPADA